MMTNKWINQAQSIIRSCECGCGGQQGDPTACKIPEEFFVSAPGSILVEFYASISLTPFNDGLDQDRVVKPRF
jgi:hypothetical protein